MLENAKKFGGAIMLYMVIFFGIIAIVSRIDCLKNESKNFNEGIIAFKK